MLKAPGTKRLKLKYDEPLSNFAFKFNLRRYYMESFQAATVRPRGRRTSLVSILVELVSNPDVRRSSLVSIHDELVSNKRTTLSVDVVVLRGTTSRMWMIPGLALWSNDHIEWCRVR